MKKSKIRRIGNSLGLTLPLEILRALDLDDGDEVCLRQAGDQLIIERFDPDLLEQMETYRAELIKFKTTFKALD